MNKLLLSAMLIFASPVEAGLFLDLDIGAHLKSYDNLESNRLVGNENPIALVRAGYKTDKYNLFGPVDISGHGYYEHMSSWADSRDIGIDVIMIGVRFE